MRNSNQDLFFFVNIFYIMILVPGNEISELLGRMRRLIRHSLPTYAITIIFKRWASGDFVILFTAKKKKKKKKKNISVLLLRIHELFSNFLSEISSKISRWALGFAKASSCRFRQEILFYSIRLPVFGFIRFFCLCFACSGIVCWSQDSVIIISKSTKFNVFEENE